MYDIFILKNLPFSFVHTQQEAGWGTCSMVAENAVYMRTKRKSPFFKKYPVGFEGASVFR